jgi:hypothetical protein
MNVARVRVFLAANRFRIAVRSAEHLKQHNMKVKIIRESVDQKWYDVHVGESFEIDERKTTDQFYFVKETFLRWIRPIYKSDCVVLNAEAETNGEKDCKNDGNAV